MGTALALGSTRTRLAGSVGRVVRPSATQVREDEERGDAQEEGREVSPALGVSFSEGLAP